MRDKGTETRGNKGTVLLSLFFGMRQKDRPLVSFDTFIALFFQGWKMTAGRSRRI